MVVAENKVTPEFNHKQECKPLLELVLSMHMLVHIGKQYNDSKWGSEPAYEVTLQVGNSISSIAREGQFQAKVRDSSSTAEVLQE